MRRKFPAGWLAEYRSHPVIALLGIVMILASGALAGAKYAGLIGAAPVVPAARVTGIPPAARNHATRAADPAEIASTGPVTATVTAAPASPGSAPATAPAVTPTASGPLPGPDPVPVPSVPAPVTSPARPGGGYP